VYKEALYFRPSPREAVNHMSVADTIWQVLPAAALPRVHLHGAAQGARSEAVPRFVAPQAEIENSV